MKQRKTQWCIQNESHRALSKYDTKFIDWKKARWPDLQNFDHSCVCVSMTTRTIRTHAIVLRLFSLHCNVFVFLPFSSIYIALINLYYLVGYSTYREFQLARSIKYSLNHFSLKFCVVPKPKLIKEVFRKYLLSIKLTVHLFLYPQ